jgi:hypothetical protein
MFRPTSAVSAAWYLPVNSELGTDSVGNGLSKCKKLYRTQISTEGRSGFSVGTRPRADVADVV